MDEARMFQLFLYVTLIITIQEETKVNINGGKSITLENKYVAFQRVQVQFIIIIECFTVPWETRKKDILLSISGTKPHVIKTIISLLS